MGVLNSESHGLCVCEVKFSLMKAIDTTMGRFSNLFNGGTSRGIIGTSTFTSSSNMMGVNSLNKSTKDLSLDYLDLESKSLDDKVEETGRIEEGTISNQKFETIAKSFNTLPFATTIYWILPFSKKPIEVSEIKVYCTDCGTRQKKTSWKHCPSCGNKYE